MKEVIIMTNYREILRLSSLGLNNTQIAQSCACSRTTVIQTLRLAREKGLSNPLPEGMSDEQTKCRTMNTSIRKCKKAA